jgi:hypothetical protein
MDTCVAAGRALDAADEATVGAFSAGRASADPHERSPHDFLEARESPDRQRATVECRLIEQFVVDALPRRTLLRATLFNQCTLLRPVRNRSDPSARRGIATLTDRDRYFGSRRIPP